jgi:hypothetical protein
MRSRVSDPAQVMFWTVLTRDLRVLARASSEDARGITRSVPGPVIATARAVLAEYEFARRRTGSAPYRGAVLGRPLGPAVTRSQGRESDRALVLLDTVRKKPQTSGAEFWFDLSQVDSVRVSGMYLGSASGPLPASLCEAANDRSFDRPLRRRLLGGLFLVGLLAGMIAVLVADFRESPHAQAQSLNAELAVTVGDRTRHE